MRKIERQMNAAIAANKEWRCANTKVVIPNDDCISVYLHGNKIADLYEGKITLYDGGYRSATTKSRLNAILRENGLGNEVVFQKDFQWFISYDNKTEEFRSGMTI